MSATQTQGSGGGGKKPPERVTTSPMPEDPGDGDGLDIISPGALESLTRGEIDIQVRTAKQYPRNTDKAKAKATTLATTDQDTAESCIYALERKDGRTGKITYINGPSVRMAEIIAVCWGNLRVSSRIIGDDGRMVTAQGVCHDLENNLAVLKDFKRRVTTREGRRFSDDMVIMSMNAAASIALRNAIFGCVPMAVWKPVYNAAAVLANGGGRPFEEMLAEWVAYFERHRVTPERYLAAIGKTSSSDITLDDLVTFRGITNRAKEEQVPVVSLFPEPAKEAPIPDASVPPGESSPSAPSQKTRPTRPAAKTLDDFANG